MKVREVGFGDNQEELKENIVDRALETVALAERLRFYDEAVLPFPHPPFRGRYLLGLNDLRSLFIAAIGDLGNQQPGQTFSPDLELFSMGSLLSSISTRSATLLIPQRTPARCAGKEPMILWTVACD